MNDGKKLNEEQNKIWLGKFGDKYIYRIETIDRSYELEIGTTLKISLQIFSEIPKNYSILELGCNVCKNIYILNKMGFENITKIEINEKTVKIAQKNNPFVQLILV